MGYVCFDQDRKFAGCRVLSLENDLLRIDLLPELGGKIYKFIHKPENRDYLWHHPRIKPAILPPGTSYDDHFSGGWDEQFPSDAPCEHEGVNYPDHGEYWTESFDWDVERIGNSITLHLWAQGPVTRTRMERWITLTTGSTAVRFKHRLTNLGEHGFDYIWKFHPALAISASHEILIPAGAGIIAEPGSGRLSADQLNFTWPHAPDCRGQTIDLSKIPATYDAAGYEMVYLTELYAGWCGIIDHASHSGFGLAFDKNVFNNVWLFQSFGGWRDLHLVVLEPSTSYPYDLSKAASCGRVARLEGGQVFKTETTAVIFTDRDTVEYIALDGTVC